MKQNEGSMQPAHQPQPGDLERKAESTFPDESERASASRLLSLHGAEEWHRGIERVRIAALYNSDQYLAKLRAQIESANIAYRDVIALAEYKAVMNLPIDVRSGSEEYETAVGMDARRYREWIES